MTKRSGPEPLPAAIRGLGGSSVEIGLIDGIANAVAALVRLPAGAISNAIGHRPLVIFGYGISAVVRPLMAVVAAPWGAILVRMADRFGKGIRSAPPSTEPGRGLGLGDGVTG